MLFGAPCPTIGPCRPSPHVADLRSGRSRGIPGPGPGPHPARPCVRTVRQRQAAAAQDPQLAEYIAKGPIMDKCGLDSSKMDAELPQWRKLANTLIKRLDFESEDKLTDDDRARIFQYYLPVFFWAQKQLQEHKATSPKPLVLGMQAPQGCGKTTLVEELQHLLEIAGYSVASVSIDDFYLTFEDQQELAQDHKGNQLLELRSNAGTHDLAMGRKVLERLLNAKEGEEVAVPRYNKAAHEGRGTRAPEDTWPRVKGPLDLILFEGWMLGFQPVDEEEAEAVSPQLKAVNKNLADYNTEWDQFVDCWLVLRVADPKYVYKWRGEAEAKMREAGKGAMTDEQVKDFVDRYMPAYEAYLPTLYDKGPAGANIDKVLMIEINEHRQLAPQQPPLPQQGDVNKYVLSDSAKVS